MKVVILATNGNWIPRKINGKWVECRPFILPLIYDMEAGCNPRSLPSAGAKNIRKEIPNHTDVALIYMLDFEDDIKGNNNQLDCVLLRPLHIFSQN